jgi:PPOX class probable F420-dependent enzyme
MLDLTKERDMHIDQRLRSDPIIWLSTVRRDGRPHTVPVWFLWDGKTILIFSQPDSQKIRNLRNNPYVTLALEGTNGGTDVIVLEGKAELLKEKTTELNQPDYFITKYGSAIQDMGEAPESLAQSYSQPIRITPTKFIAWSE